MYQNTVYGLAARLPFKYTGAVVLGSVRMTFCKDKIRKFAKSVSVSSRRT